MSVPHLIVELRRDAGMTVRQLRRAPTFALIATITLALGSGAISAVFAVADAVLFRPLPFANPEQLFLVRRVRVSSPGLAVSSAWCRLRVDPASVLRVE